MKGDNAMEKCNQNQNFENENQPKLPELEQRTVTPFRGMADYVQDMAELFNQDRFEILVPLTSEDSIFYECSFADAKQAELYFENSCRAEKSEDFNFWVNLLNREMLYVWNMGLRSAKK